MNSMSLASIQHPRLPAFFSEDSLTKMMRKMTTKQIKARSTIFKFGEGLERLYYIRNGQALIKRKAFDQKEFILHLLREGDIFSTISEMGDLSARAITECEIGVLDRVDLDDLLLEEGRFAVEFTQFLESSRRAADSKLRDLLFFGKRGALCSMLIRLAKNFGKPVKEGMMITVRLTNVELAHLTGSSRENVNRMIRDLREQGI
ncbi:Crp/Fnr family transcriptional regulator [Ammoniphilus sp. CFH 90114]|uniref:Crp/Fnr family transcriptional regulator n=1 Tax=Ammoniphilus sp. CFH 90114 TaxID=2493665 RepID=UPI00100F915F|nr:Crp/Fnr family transcriptional regulator [Ammoniphilus sp. CFH 90114]RXT07061.1 Crp/Fnr family transcriptional regulator [Ammoniphilus sp. CFH 90114]